MLDLFQSAVNVGFFVGSVGIGYIADRWVPQALKALEFTCPCWNTTLSHSDRLQRPGPPLVVLTISDLFFCMDKHGRCCYFLVRWVIEGCFSIRPQVSLGALPRSLEYKGRLIGGLIPFGVPSRSLRTSELSLLFLPLILPEPEQTRPPAVLTLAHGIAGFLNWGPEARCNYKYGT